MIVKIIPFLILPVIFGAFTVSVKWATNARTSIHLESVSQDEFTQKCLEGGLEVRYRYELRLCRRRMGWLDTCGNTLTQVRTIQFDPISERYSVAIDIHHDEVAPERKIIESEQEARRAVSALEDFPLNAIPHNEYDQDPTRAYIGVRVRSECRGLSSGILEQIPLILSFGLIDTSTQDSGWVAFDAEGSKIEK